MDCGSGLLLLLMRTIRRLDDPGSDGAEPAFSTGPATLIGHRLWLYGNFHCNLACHYCCAKSSPQAPARLLPVSLALAAAEELCTLGGRELLVTGGEPFLRPDIGAMVTQLAARLPVTLLTNAMLFDRGARLQALESMPRDRVTLQVSVDSAGPALHDRHRGRGSHARALAGIARARRLGFAVKVAATLYDDEADQAAELNAYFDGWASTKAIGLSARSPSRASPIVATGSASIPCSPNQP